MCVFTLVNAPNVKKLCRPKLKRAPDSNSDAEIASTGTSSCLLPTPILKDNIELQRNFEIKQIKNLNELKIKFNM